LLFRLFTRQITRTIPSFSRNQNVDGGWGIAAGASVRIFPAQKMRLFRPLRDPGIIL
jgi:hypothetical protein